MTMITHLNYATKLEQSTAPRGATPTGNVYFDVATNKIQLIGADELPYLDAPTNTVPNELTNTDGITLRALYRFENSRRRLDETLRKYERGTSGSYRFAGAFNFINGVTLDGTDRNKIRGSGWIEYANTGDGATDVDRIYHGVQSLVAIQAGTTSYWTLVTATDEATLQAATWTDFVRTGPINEAVQVFGSAAHGNFDYTTRTLVARTRSWGYNPGETTSILTGIAEFSGFSAGYGVGESLNANNTEAIANVYGVANIAPWTGMSLEKLVTPQNEGGFSGGGTAPFSWILHNTGGVPGVPGTVQQCAAFLDALALQDADIDSGAGTYNGKKGRVWYSRNAAGKLVTSIGLFIESLSTVEKQNVVMTDNNSVEKTYPFYPTVEITVGSAAVADADAWYEVFYAPLSGSYQFDTATAVTVNNQAGSPVRGNVSADQVSGKISFTYDFDGNTQAGMTAPTERPIVVLVEGDRSGASDAAVGQALTYATITRTAIVPVTCVPATDNNA